MAFFSINLQKLVKAPRVGKFLKNWVQLEDLETKHKPPKFNMEPKNEGLEDAFPFHMGDSQVRC